MESFEDFGIKMVSRVVLISKVVGRKGQGHCLTFDP